MAYLLSVNTSHVNKLPKDTSPARWAAYNDAFQNTELSSGEIAHTIRSGYAIAPQCDGRRKASNFRQAQHIGVDMDDGTYTWDELVHLPLILEHAAIIHTTASSTPTDPRYRVIFLLEEPITDAAEYRYAVRCFMKAAGHADPTCKDAARLFFGAKGCSLLHQPENIVSPDDLAYILATWPADADAPAMVENSRTIATAGAVAISTNGSTISPADLSPARRDAHLDALLSKVRTCPDGSKWFTLRDVSYTLGGYAASNYFTFSELQTALRQAIETRRATVASMPAAYATIDEALTAGAAFPLYYERSERGGASTEKFSVTPPTDARGRLRWILEKRRTELEAAIAAADLATCDDFEAMTHEYTLVMERLEATA